MQLLRATACSAKMMNSQSKPCDDLGMRLGAISSHKLFFFQAAFLARNIEAYERDGMQLKQFGRAGWSETYPPGNINK